MIHSYALLVVKAIIVKVIRPHSSEGGHDRCIGHKRSLTLLNFDLGERVCIDHFLKLLFQGQAQILLHFLRVVEALTEFRKLLLFLELE